METPKPERTDGWWLLNPRTLRAWQSNTKRNMKAKKKRQKCKIKKQNYMNDLSHELHMASLDQIRKGYLKCSSGITIDQTERWMRNLTIIVAISGTKCRALNESKQSKQNTHLEEKKMTQGTWKPRLSPQACGSPRTQNKNEVSDHVQEMIDDLFRTAANWVRKMIMISD